MAEIRITQEAFLAEVVNEDAADFTTQAEFLAAAVNDDANVFLTQEIFLAEAVNEDADDFMTQIVWLAILRRQSIVGPCLELIGCNT